MTECNCGKQAFASHAEALTTFSRISQRNGIRRNALTPYLAACGCIT